MKSILKPTYWITGVLALALLFSISSNQRPHALAQEESETTEFGEEVESFLRSEQSEHDDEAGEDDFDEGDENSPDQDEDFDASDEQFRDQDELEEGDWDDEEREENEESFGEEDFGEEGSLEQDFDEDFDRDFDNDVHEEDWHEGSLGFAEMLAEVAVDELRTAAFTIQHMAESMEVEELVSVLQEARESTEDSARRRLLTLALMKLQSESGQERQALELGRELLIGR
ncbi:MAG: hypothetical protein AAF483_02710 [Planctomycetota bacterium]